MAAALSVKPVRIDATVRLIRDDDALHEITRWMAQIDKKLDELHTQFAELRVEQGKLRLLEREAGTLETAVAAHQPPKAGE